MDAPDIVRLVAIVATFWALGAVPLAIVIGLRERGVDVTAPTYLLILLVVVQLAGGIIALVDNLGTPFVWYGSPRYILIALIATAFLTVARRRSRARARAARAQPAR